MRGRLWLAACLLLWAWPASAAVAVDSNASSTTGTADPQTWTHTVVGTLRAVIVHCVRDGSGTDPFNTATYGGVAMTEISTSPIGDAISEQGTISMFFLGASVPAGNQTVSVDKTSAVSTRCGSIGFTAAVDVEIVDTPTALNSASATNPSLAFAFGGRTSIPVLWIWSGLDDLASLTNTGTSVNSADLGAAISRATYDTATASDGSFGFTAAAEETLLLGVAISEVSGGLVSSRGTLVGVGP